MIVLRMALRELWRARARIALLALVLAMQVMTIGGAYVSVTSFDATRDHYYDVLRCADLEVGFAPAADDELPRLADLRKIPGVRGVSRRYVTAGTIEAPGSVPWPVIVVYLDSGAQEVNDIAVLHGRGIDPSEPRGVVIDRGFAEHRGMKLGDPVVVNPYRFASRFTVSGVGLSPEFLAPAIDPGFLMSAKGSLGIIYAPRPQLDALFVERLYDDLVFTYAPGADPEATQRAILTALRGLDLREITPRRSNVGHRLLEEMLRTPRVLAPILALLVGLLAAIVAYVLMARIIASQRREIGALLAIGFPAWQFVLGYLGLALAPAALGACAGGVLARVFGRSYALYQARLIGLPDPIMATPLGLIALSALFAISVTLLGALVPLLGILRLSPAAAMRGGQEIAFRSLPAPLERAASLGRATVRYTVRNVLRRTRLSGAVVALVGAGVAAPATVLTTVSSWERWSVEVGEKLRWDATVTFRVPLAPDALATVKSAPGLRDAETFLQGRATLVRGGDGHAPPRVVGVRGMAVPARLDPRELTAGRDLGGDDALEAIVNEGLARDDAPVRVGDALRLTSSNGVSLDLRVVGLVHDAAANTVHVPLRIAQRLLGTGDKVSGMFVRYGPMTSRLAPPPRLPDAPAPPESAEIIDMEGIDTGVDAGAAAAPSAEDDLPKTPGVALLRAEMVVGLQSRAEAVNIERRFMREQRSAIFPFLTVAMCFAFAAILSVLGILLVERATEYATLRAIGYGRASIARVVFLEVFTLAALGLAGGLVAWIVLSAYLNQSLAKSLFPIPLDYRARDFATVTLPMLAFFALSAAAGVRAIVRLNLREVLTSRTIG